MTEEQERAAVVREALSWVRTPFKWEASIKGVGVDCARIIAASFSNPGVASVDIAKLPRVSPQWFMNCEKAVYIDGVKNMLNAVEYNMQDEIPQPGDVVLAKYGRDWAHGAIVVEWPKVVAAAPGRGVVIWKNIYESPHYMGRELKLFRLSHWHGVAR